MWPFKLIVFVSVLVQCVVAGFPNENNTLWDYTASPEDIQNNHIELMKLYMNTSVEPCDDFYEYSCGNWKNVNEMHSKIQNVPGVLYEKVQQVLKELIQELSETEEDNDIKLFYKSCMDIDIISERGNKPAIDFLKTFDGWPISNYSNEYIDWLHLSAELALYDNKYLLTVHIDNEKTLDDEVIYIMALSPYQKKSQAELENITNFIMGVALSNNILEEMAAFEESFRTACINMYDNISLITLEDLLIEEPHIDWQRYLSILLQKRVHLTQKVLAPINNLKAVGVLLNNTSSRIVANYMLYNFMADMVYEFVNVNAVYKRSTTRAEYCAKYIQNNLYKILSKTFVEKYLDESANDRAKQLSEEIREAFSEFIGNIFWIDNTTKEIAREKVNSIQLKVGYTSQDLENDVNSLDLKSNEFFENAMKLRLHVTKTFWYVKPGETRDRSRNVIQHKLEAFYDRKENTTGHVYVTAAMLQPPLFNNYFPNWINYGGIGYIIGHELTHGFNTKFIKARDNEPDSEWWSPESFKEYIIRTLCYSFQYDKYKFEDMGISIDGQKTLNENMADNGGLKFGYEAYKKWLKNHPDSDENQINPVLNLSGKQLYFVSFAQTLCNATNKEEIEERLMYDPHTPSIFRVIGSVTNSYDFAKAFQCPIGSPMNPPRKCQF